MPTEQVQDKIMEELREHTELSLNDLVRHVLPDAPSGRNAVKAAVVPLLYQRLVTLTPARKFRIGK